MAGGINRLKPVSQSTEWGEIGSDETEIETMVSVMNPMHVYPDNNSLSVNYSLRANGVEMARGETVKVENRASRINFSISSSIPHSSIMEWWPTHIKNDESTALEIHPRINFDSGVVDIDIPIPSQSAVIETEIEESISDDEPGVKEIFAWEIARIKEIDYSWVEVHGEYTLGSTVISVENPTRFPLPMDRLELDISINDIDIGYGVSDPIGFISSGDSREIEIYTHIEHDGLEAWWPTHLENDEYSTLEIDVYGKYLGFRYPRPMYSITEEIDTDILDF